MRFSKSLDEIGFYTLSTERARNTGPFTPLQRCEMILTDRCSFKCPYCRGLRSDLAGDIPFDQALKTLELWIKDGLRNVRFSGGEPTLYSGLSDLVATCRNGDVERIAISTNGASSLSLYERLIAAGANDFSISLDACCASLGDIMAGIKGAWKKVINNIKALSEMTYVTVGMVFTEDNIDKCIDSVLFADSLGVSDIRVIPSAQYNQALTKLASLPSDILKKYPILDYRIRNVRHECHVRGIQSGDVDRCALVLDDMAVAMDKHFPCIIYMREYGDPIGTVGPNMRAERLEWFKSHNTQSDPICRKNCLDVCVQHNNTTATQNMRVQLLLSS